MTELLLRLLRVPPRPDPPPGDEASLRTFRSSKKLLYLAIVRWALGQAGAIIGLVVSFVLVNRFEEELSQEVEIGLPLISITAPISGFIQLFELLALPLFLLQLAIGYFFVRLAWEQRWYMLSNRALRLREGIWRVKEQTMTIANVQNMAVRQGPLARLLDISNLEVHTAGGGGGELEGEATMHRGLLLGLDDAAEVRDQIRSVLKQHRDAGLGDPGDRRLRSSASSSVQEVDTSWSVIGEMAEDLRREALELRNSTSRA